VHVDSTAWVFLFTIVSRFDAPTDSEDDDHGGVDLRCLPAAVPRLILRRQPASSHTGKHVVSTALSRHLLAGYE